MKSLLKARRQQGAPLDQRGASQRTGSQSRSLDVMVVRLQLLMSMLSLKITDGHRMHAYFPSSRHPAGRAFAACGARQRPRG